MLKLIEIFTESALKTVGYLLQGWILKKIENSKCHYNGILPQCIHQLEKKDTIQLTENLINKIH